nr:hypothetical protein B0A51_07658 [Rachicladosporium sp. CCFEE 5018]
MAEIPLLLLGMPEHVDFQAGNTVQITTFSSTAADGMGIAEDESTPTMTGIFEFFSLPPELRMSIYDLLWEERHTPPTSKNSTKGMNYSGQIPVVRARLISRQVRDEIDRMAPTAYPLVLQDHRHVELMEPEKCLEIPTWARRSTSLKVIFLVTWENDGLGDIGEDWYAIDIGISWLRRMMVKLENVTKMSFTIHFERRAGAGELWPLIERGIQRLVAAFPCTTCVRAVAIQRSEDRVLDANADADGVEKSTRSEQQPQEALAPAETENARKVTDGSPAASSPMAYPVGRCVATWTLEQGLMVNKEEVKKMQALVAIPA